MSNQLKIRAVESVDDACRFGGGIASEKYQGGSYDSATRYERGWSRGW